MRRRPVEPRPGRPRERSVVRQALLRFTAWSIIALTFLAVGTILVSNHIARDEAVRDARVRGAGIAHGVAAPLVDHRVRAGMPSAVAQLDVAIENRMRDRSVNHVKLWSRDGRVIWSDEEELVGRTFDLPVDVVALFGTDNTVTELSGLDRADNVGDRAEGPLLEVYVGAFDAEGVPLVFEAYISSERLDEDRAAIFAELLPLALGVLLAFQVTMLPLAISLARRVERGQAERADILRRALMSSDLERRRIAEDLHDGVIQDLAGLSYALPTLAANLSPEPSADRARATAQQMLVILQRDVSGLRSLLADIYPPDLDGDGLAAALDDLVTGAAESRVAVKVEMSPGLEVPLDTARLVYRIVREGLRNVVRHADAARAEVTVRRQGGEVLVRVCDDGRGLSGADEAGRGHLGVKLLADTVNDLGGRLDLHPGETGGTVLEARFPSRLPG